MDELTITQGSPRALREAIKDLSGLARDYTGDISESFNTAIAALWRWYDSQLTLQVSWPSAIAAPEVIHTKPAKIWVLSIEACTHGDVDTFVYCFYDEDTARRAMKQEIDDFMKYDHLAQAEDAKFEQDENSFVAYAEYNFTEDHYCVDLKPNEMDSYHFYTKG